MSTAHQEPSPAVLSPHHSGPTGPSSTWLSSGAQAADVKLQVGQDVFHGDFNVLLNFERGHSNRRSKHNAAFSWNCPKLLVQAFVLFRDSFRDWQPKMLQTCTHAMEISTTNMRTNISNVTRKKITRNFFFDPTLSLPITKRFPSAPISTTEQIETYTPTSAHLH